MRAVRLATPTNPKSITTSDGYVNELGGHRASGSGHLALSQLLRDPNIDGIASPYKYGLNQFRRPTGNFGEF